MRIKLSGGVFSSPRQMPGGAPQGTRCGNLLFCIAVADLHIKGSSQQYLVGGDILTDSTHLSSEEEDTYGHRDITARLHNEKREGPSSPLGGTRLDLRLNGKLDHFEDSGDEWPPTPSTHATLARWKETAAKMSKFIDDINAMEKCDITSGHSIFTTKKEQRFIHAKKCQDFLETVTENASTIGMVVNPHKMQVLCTTTAIKAGGVEILSGDSLKSVGYSFGRRPGAAEYLRKTRQKYGARAGTLRHLHK